MRIRAKANYNVHITDINVSLQHSKGFVEIDDDVFNNSQDAKRLAQFIEIENINTSSKNTVTAKAVKDSAVTMKQISNTAFVVTADEPAKQSGTIVFDPNNEADLNKVTTPEIILSSQDVISAPVQQDIIAEVTSNTIIENAKEQSPDATLKKEIKAEVNDTQSQVAEQVVDENIINSEQIVDAVSTNNEEKDITSEFVVADKKNKKKSKK